jgi:hypothetical protein
MLIAQLVVANEAALDLYRRAWACDPADYFEAHMKYMQLAGKVSRTVAMLTERLDHHRGRGQQQMIVKHVTVNADQAMVADSIVTGRTNDVVSAAKLLPATIEADAKYRNKQVGSGAGRGGWEAKLSINPMQRAHAAPRCSAHSKRTGKPCRAPVVRGYRVCRMHGARGGAPEGKQNGNYRHGVRSREIIGASKLIKSLS